MTEKQFEKENVFGLGNENTAFAQFFIGKSYLNPLTPAGVSPLFCKRDFRAGLPQQLAHSSREERRRADPSVRGRQRLVSGGGQAGAEPESRRRGRHSGGRQTLARREEGLLVFPHRRGGARRGDPQRMAGGRFGRGIRETVILYGDAEGKIPFPARAGRGRIRKIIRRGGKH